MLDSLLISPTNPWRWADEKVLYFNQFIFQNVYHFLVPKISFSLAHRRGIKKSMVYLWNRAD